jgi:tRNA (mo5U34)-methyltransferase
MRDYNIQTLVDSINWWHSIDFGEGVVSKGKAFNGDPQKQIGRLQFPDGIFKDKNVLDIGCWDGVYSFHAEKMGAKSVVAIDTDEYNLGSKGFDLAKRILISNVRRETMDVMDLVPDFGMFDVIIFSGVLYHLEHPCQALSNVLACLNPGGTLIIETHVHSITEDLPIMQFHPGKTLKGDPTNFWSPNMLCLRKMLEEKGNIEINTLVKYNKERALCYCRKVADE